MNQQKPPQQINIEIGEKESEGIYSNLALIAHSPAEFFLDFARMVPGSGQATVHTRVIMTPAHVKFLINALKDNVERYEKQFGEIKLHGAPTGPAGEFGLRPISTEEK